MGSFANYEVDLSISYSMKKEKKNTIEECEAFLSSKKNFTINYGSPVTKTIMEKLYSSDKDFTLFLGHKKSDNMSSKEHSLEDILDYFIRCSHVKPGFSIKVFSPAKVSDIEYLDLELAEKVETIGITFIHTEEVASVDGYISCDVDNTITKDVPVEALSKLMRLPNAKLILRGTGNG
jgi:hypothetical protein